MSVRSPDMMKVNHEATRRNTKMFYESSPSSSCVLVCLRGSIIFKGGIQVILNDLCTHC